MSCIKPIMLNRDGSYKMVPCGKCADCKKSRTAQWAFRLMEEERVSSSSYFVTLTYNDEKLKGTKNGLPTLDKRDVQLFMKRLRKRNTDKLKYYLCGEYGRSERPHYHLLLFNAILETIEPAWDSGFCHFGKVEQSSIFYTLKYMCKKGKVGKKEWDDRVKEFALMSKGLGKSYVNDVKYNNWHKEDLINRNYCNMQGGTRTAMPRYYKEKIYSKDELLALKGFHSEKYRSEIEERLKRKDADKMLWNRKQAIEYKERKLNLENLNEKL